MLVYHLKCGASLYIAYLDASKYSRDLLNTLTLVKLSESRLNSSSHLVLGYKKVCGGKRGYLRRVCNAYYLRARGYFS